MSASVSGDKKFTVVGLASHHLFEARHLEFTVFLFCFCLLSFQPSIAAPSPLWLRGIYKIDD